MTELAAARLEPGLGLFEQPAPAAISGVTGQPSWALFKDGQVLSFANAQQVSDGVLVASVGPLTSLEAPVNAALVPNANGSSTLIATSGFMLLAGEVDPKTVGTRVGQVPLRFTAGAPIGSIAFPTPVQPMTGYLEGYAVAGNEVLRLTSAAIHRWSSLAIALPPALTPLEVWFDIERARAGFTDGTVLSLPSRVPIAPALAREEVIDYEQVCGQQLALGSRALYRLEPVPGRSMGAWVPLPLPQGFGTEGFARGRAHRVGSELYVFTRSGQTARWKFANCPVP